MAIDLDVDVDARLEPVGMDDTLRDPIDAARL
jgi:hypothetical protein